jgi:hypothetical protein
MKTALLPGANGLVGNYCLHFLLAHSPASAGESRPLEAPAISLLQKAPFLLLDHLIYNPRGLD